MVFLSIYRADVADSPRAMKGLNTIHASRKVVMENPGKGIYIELTRPIIGAAIEVHRYIGPGLMESAYETCLCHELNQRGIHFLRQVDIPLSYKGLKLDCSYRADLVIGDVVVELKAVDGILPIHEAQLMTYMKLLNKPVGLVINFNVPVLKDGVRRRVLN